MDMYSENTMPQVPEAPLLNLDMGSWDTFAITVRYNLQLLFIIHLSILT